LVEKERNRNFKRASQSNENLIRNFIEMKYFLTNNLINHSLI